MPWQLSIRAGGRLWASVVGGVASSGSGIGLVRVGYAASCLRAPGNSISSKHSSALHPGWGAGAPRPRPEGRLRQAPRPPFTYLQG